MMHIQLCF